MNVKNSEFGKNCRNTILIIKKILKVIEDDKIAKGYSDVISLKKWKAGMPR